MELLGFSLGQVLALLSAAGAAIVILYLLKLRRRQVRVPFVRLWQTVLAEKQTTQLFARLKRLISLLVALLVAALLSFAVGDPRCTGARADGRTVVVLLDASASMQAVDVAPSRFEAGKAQIRSLIEGMNGSDRMLIAKMDTTTTPLTPMSEEPAVLKRALANARPSDTQADFASGLRFARNVLHGQRRAEVVVVTDGGLAQDVNDEVPGARFSWIRLGQSKKNVGITAFAVRRYPLDKTQSEVLVELWNASDQKQDVELTLLGDGESIEVQRLSLGPKERLGRFFGNISGVDKTLEARLQLPGGARDDLPVDDRAFARLPERRRARVLTVTRGNLYLSAALLLDEYLEVTEVAPQNYTAEGTFDVVIFDDFVPATPPASPTLYLHPAPGTGITGPLEVIGKVTRPFFNVVDRKHPLVRWTDLYSVNVAEALQVRLGEGDKMIAGDRQTPLLVVGTRSGKPMVAATFDVRQTDLPLRIAWPLMLLNAIDWFVSEESGFLSSYRTGETWHVPVPIETGRAEIRDPDGRTRTVPVVNGRALVNGVRSGFYRVRTERSNDVIAANLGGGDETDIAPRQRLLAKGRAAGKVTPPRMSLRTELWVYFVLAALAVVLFEWFSYHRRWTV